MIDDASLLRRYAHEHSQAAFEELVRRYLDLVYAAAMRRLGGDAHRAADVAQVVFATLAPDSATLAGHTVLAGWLYTATRNAALNVLRAEDRRRIREQEAYRMQEFFSPAESGADWQQLRPVLDAAMDELEERDREAVLLRFFQGWPFADVATALRVSEDTARKRVERALEKLRDRLAKRGIASTAAALGTALAGQAGLTAPTTLAYAIVSSAAAGADAAAVTAGAIGFMISTKAMVALTVSVALNVALPLFSFVRYSDDEGRPVASVHAPPPRAAGLSIEREFLAKTDPRLLLDDPLALANRLRDEGFSEGVIRSVVGAVAHQNLVSDPQIRAALFRPRVRWNPSAQQPGEMDAHKRVADGIDRAIEQAGLSNVTISDQIRLGDIPPQKRAAVLDLEKIYRELREKASRDSNGIVESPLGDLFESEFERDLAALLPPDEFKTFMRRNSAGAKHALAILAAGAEVAESTRNALIDATIASQKEERASRGNPRAEAEIHLRLIEQYRVQLGDEAFLNRGRLFSRLAAEADSRLVGAMPVEQRAELFLSVVRILGALQAAAPDERPSLAAAGYRDLAAKTQAAKGGVEDFAATKLGEFLAVAQKASP